MADKRWKQQERRVARALGAQRNPHDGTGKSDAESDWLVIENRDRKTVPRWITEALRDARRKAGSGRLGIGTITTPYSREVLVVMDLRDFVEWFGERERAG